jgi:hypothetical protein
MRPNQWRGGQGHNRGKHVRHADSRASHEASCDARQSEGRASHCECQGSAGAQRAHQRAMASSTAPSESRVHILVYIVSHQDLVFRLEGSVPDEDGAAALPLAKPKFHRFNVATTKAYMHMDQHAMAPVGRRLRGRAGRGLDWSGARVAATTGGITLEEEPLSAWEATRQVEKERVESEVDEISKHVPASTFPRFAVVDHEEATTGRRFAVGMTLDPPMDFSKVSDKSWDVGMGWGDFSLRNPAFGELAPPRATQVLFPLLAAILPRWRTAIRQEDAKQRRHASASADERPSRRILLLLSGSGVPRNEAHSVQDNSTMYTSRLIRRFVSWVWKDTEVWIAHSHRDVFRIDQNFEFLRSVQSLLGAFRKRIVHTYGADWLSRFGVSLALAGGTPARVAAVTASLRPFAPDIYHMFELKRLWYSNTLSFQDVDHRSFATAAATHEVDASALPYELRRLVDEMRSHYQDFAKVRDAPAESDFATNDLQGFWMRKSKKPVLAVLLVRWPDHRDPVTGETSYRYETFRGINMEVSLPTGSLCSERAAIAAALAQRPHLKRENCVAIAVLSASLMPNRLRPAATDVLATALSSRRSESGSSLRQSFSFTTPAASPGLSADEVFIPEHLPQGLALELMGRRPPKCDVGGLGFVEAPLGVACSDVFAALSEFSTSSRSAGTDSLVAPRLPHPVRVVASESESDTDESSSDQDQSVSSPARESSDRSSTKSFRRVDEMRIVPLTEAPLVDPVMEAIEGGVAPAQDETSSVRRTLSRPSMSPTASVSATISAMPVELSKSMADALDQGLFLGCSHSDVVSNPLPPCGSCSEWLRKIHEAQPDFRVLLFQDTSCARVIIKSVE